MSHNEDPMVENLSNVPDHLLGPLIVGYLAYPGKSEGRKRIETMVRLGPYEVAEALFAAQDALAVGTRARPRRLDKFLKNGRGQLEGRLRKRLDVGHVVHSGLVARRENDLSLLRAGKWSRRRTAEHLYQRGDLPPWPNFDKHWWQSCRSILHLAAAWYEVLYFDQKENGDFGGVLRLLENPSFGHRVLARAMELEPRMAEVEIPVEQLTKFRV